MISKEDRARLRETLRPRLEGDPYIVGVIHQRRPSLDGDAAIQLLDELDALEAVADAVENSWFPYEHIGTCEYMKDYRGCRCGYEEVNAALAALNKLRGK